MKTYLLITLGGTIDSAPYPEEDGQYPKNATPTGENRAYQALKDIFERKAKGCVLEHISLADLDSKDIYEPHQDHIFALVNNADYERIIITMGTDRMSETACDLLSRAPNLKCPVIFTGAIWPLANGEKSDGWKNLEQAALDKSNLKPAVYIAMGNVFGYANNISKDFENKKFIDHGAPLP